MSYNANGLLNSDGSVTQFGNTRSSGGGGGVGTVINLTTLYSALFNQTVTLTGTYDTYTATFDSTGHATVNVFYIDTYAVTCQGETDSVTVTAIGLVINADVFSVTVVNLTTPYSALFNQTVTLTGTNATYTSSFDASGYATVNVLYTDTYTVTCQSLTDSVTVSTLGTVVNATVFDITAVTLSSSDSQLVGATCTVYKGNPTDADVRMTTTLDSTLSFTFQTDETGSYTLTTTYSGVTIPTTFTVSSIGTTMSVTIESVPLKTWATATDSEVVAMVDAADKGYIDLHNDCSWRVGQERTVSVSAINSSGTYDGISWSVGESQPQQTITLVLLHEGDYELVTPVLNKDGTSRSTVSFVYGVKGVLSQPGYMEIANGSTYTGWETCPRRNWCNGGFRQALPSGIRSVSKQVKVKTAPNSSTLATVYDYISFAAACEIHLPMSGVNVTTYNIENEAVTLFDYYNTSNNRIKYLNDTAVVWRTRSTSVDYSQTHIILDTGIGSREYANNNQYLSPIGFL